MGVVCIAKPPPPLATGYWGLGNDGGVFAVGGANYYGSLPGSGVTVSDAVALAPTPSGNGYWIVRAGGGGVIANYGEAGPYGTGSLSNPAVGVASYPGPSQGFWIVDNQGNVDAFGSSAYLGGGGLSNVVGLIPTADGNGYWIITSSGGVHNYGTAAAIGSFTPSFPVVIGARTPDGGGFICADALGGAYALGDADFQNSLFGLSISPPAFVTSLAVSGDGGGYWMVDYNGNVYSFGDAAYAGAL
jgi:hypothetical protein